MEEDRNHLVSQIILDTSQNAVYDNRLAVWGREGGEYRCRVSNNIPFYYSQLTYLSHNSSYMVIEGANVLRMCILCLLQKIMLLC